MRAALAALTLAGCGQAWPAGWGDACERDTCRDRYVCLAIPTRCTAPCSRDGGAFDDAGACTCRSGRCEIVCDADAGCTGEMRCRDGFCRVPCGVGFPACPTGTFCHASSGCAPS